MNTDAQTHVGTHRISKQNVTCAYKISYQPFFFKPYFMLYTFYAVKEEKKNFQNAYEI